MNDNIELIELIESEDYPAIIKYLIHELIDNSTEAQISIRNYELSSEERQFVQLFLFGPNLDDFSAKVDEFYSVFDNKIRKEIIKNRKSDYFVLYNQDIIDTFNMHDYRQFNYKINTNIVVINVNNIKYLTIILNNIDDFVITAKHIHNIKLIKYFYKNFENSLIINQLDNETNFLVNSNISLIEYLGKISSHLPGFIYQFKMSPDGSFSIPFASEKIFDVFGLTQQQVYDNANLVFEIIHPEDADRCKFAIMESANNLTTWKLQYRIIKNGQEVWIDGESRPELKSDGSILWHGYASSISDIMMLQQKMEESEAYKRSLLGAINKSVIVSIAGLDGKIKEVNDAFVDVSHFSREELIGQDHRIVNSGLHPKSLWYEMWRDIKKGISWRAEVRNKTKYGSYYWVDTVVNPIFDNNNKIIEYLSIRYDITQKKNAEFNLLELNKNLENLVEERTKDLSNAIKDLDQQNEELLHTQNQLSKALNVKNQFISIIAHDIKNSLTSINLLSDMIINYNDKLKEEEKLLKISNIKSTSTLLAELLSEMLMWSKSQSGDLEIEIRENNLTSLLSNLIILYGLKDKNENFDINFKLDEQILLNFDYNILNTIIRNLLSNAVKFSGENGKVGLYVYKHEDYTDITISDNGVGMTIEQVDILLDITKSKKLITNSKQKGTGFGINLCLELTKKIGGEFLVESEPNKGTKITVRIPT